MYFQNPDTGFKTQIFVNFNNEIKILKPSLCFWTWLCISKYWKKLLVCVLKTCCGFQNTNKKHYACQPPLRNVFVFWNTYIGFENIFQSHLQCFKTHKNFMLSYICVLQHASVFESTQFYSGCLFWNPALDYKIQRHYRIGGLNPLRCAFVFWNLSLSFEILECVSNQFTMSSLVFWNPCLFFQLLSGVCLKSTFKILVCVLKPCSGL